MQLMTSRISEGRANELFLVAVLGGAGVGTAQEVLRSWLNSGVGDAAA